MNGKNFTQSFFLVFFLLFAAALTAQINIEFDTKPEEVNLCGATSLSYFTLEIGPDTEADSVVIRMPAGIHYVAGSLETVNGNGLTLSEIDLSVPNRPVFIPNGNGILEFTIAKTGDCETVSFTNTGKLAEDTLQVYGEDALLAGASSSSYNINYPSLTLQYVRNSAKDTVINDLPSNVCRELRVANGGTGYLSSMTQTVTVPAGIEDYTLSYGGNVLTPVSTDGDVRVYELELAEEDYLYNGESLILEECFTVSSCDFEKETIRHETAWGCGGEKCDTRVTEGTIQLQFFQPKLDSEVVSLDNVLCTDGTDAGYIHMRVWNDGAGPAVLKRVLFDAEGINTALVTGSMKVTFKGSDISSYFSDVTTNTDAGLGCGSDVISYHLQSTELESSFQLAPGDTIDLEMEFVMCCPGDVCGDYELANPFIQVIGTDLCGSGNHEATKNAGLGGTGSVANPIVTGKSVLGHNEISTFCVDYPNYQFFNTDPENSYVGFKIGAPDGLVFEDPHNTTAVRIGGNSTNIIDHIVDNGDEIVAFVLLEHIPAIPVEPLQICFTLRADCSLGSGDMGSLVLGQTTSLDCTDCLIELNCYEHDILVLGCGDEGDCDEGGGEIQDYEVERVTYGLIDPEDTRDWEDWVKADSSDINLKRVLIGDTIRHQSTLVFNEGGDNTAWDGAQYTETYTRGAENWLCPVEAWVVIKGGTDTYVVEGLEPAQITTGFVYDLSPGSLAGLPGSPLPVDYVFSDSDTLYLRTKYKFCDDGSGWYAHGPWAYYPDRPKENVIFTGEFEAKAVNENEYRSCGQPRYDEMLFLGAALSVEIKQGGTSGSGCDQNFRYLFEVNQNIGGVLSGHTGAYDFFPDEFRGLYIPDSIVVKKQADVFFAQARLVTRQINGDPPFQETMDEDIPLTYETDSTWVFKVNEVHDAFGGMFPYDEENADLRYYIEFQRTCALGRRISTDLSISYTTPLEAGESFAETKENFATAQGSDLANIQLIQRPVTQSALDKNVCYDLEVTPGGGKLNYTWLQITDSNNVSIVSVSGPNGVVLADANGLYRLGEHAGSTKKIYTICVSADECGDGDFEVLVGWDCMGYPDEVNYENECSDFKTRQFFLENEDSELQFNLYSQPGRDPRPQLCDQIVYELFFNSANEGSVVRPRMSMEIPVGFEIDSVLVEYPRNSGNFEKIAHLINGNIMEVEAYEHTALAHDSLLGLGTTSDVDPRQIFVQLYAQTTCDFRSGSRLYFTSYGERPCGGPVIGNGRRLATDPLVIEGLEPYIAEPVISVEGDAVTCGAETSINFTYTIEDGDFVGTDSSMITLPAGIEFVAGSLTCEDGDCPQVVRVEENPDEAGGTLVYVAYPEILTGGTEVSFSINVVAQGSLSCEEGVRVSLENFVTVDGLTCGDDLTCPNTMTGITGTDTVTLQVEFAEFVFDEFRADTIAGVPNVEYEGVIRATELGLQEGESLMVKIYCADGSGLASGTALDSVLIEGPLTEGGTLDFEGYFLKSACPLENGLVATLETVQGCMCTDPAIYQEEIGKEEERNAGVVLTKSVQSEPEPTGNVNEFTITYVIEVADTSGNPSYYDLSDTLRYGAGAEFVSAEVTYEGTDGLQTSILEAQPADTAFAIVMNERVRNRLSDKYLVTVVFTIDPNVLTKESADCDLSNDDGPGTGLLNEAVLDGAVPESRDSTCAEIPIPGVELVKTIWSEPAPTGGMNEFSVTYVISVTDTAGVRAFYDLSDTVQLGLGAEFVSAEVTYGGDGLNTGLVTSTSADSAFLIVDDEWIEDFGIDSFYVEVIYKIDPNVLTKESAACDPSNDGDGHTGLTNIAVIGDAVPVDRDTACTEIPIPGVVLTKTLWSDPQPTGLYREFSMTYVLTVEDTTGVRAFYDLTDEIQYGQGAAFKEAHITYAGSVGNSLHTSILNDNPTSFPYQIVDDEWIEDFGIDSFYVEVIFEVDPYEITEESKDCDYEGPEGENGGLRNVAMIDDGIPVAYDTACAPIPDPEVVFTKIITDGPTPTGNPANPFEYILEYDITVEDVLDFRSFYDLGDTLKFASSATITSIEVTYTGDDGLQTSILDPNPLSPEFEIVKDEEVSDLRTDRYHVVVIFEVDPQTFDASTMKCKDGGGDINHGLKNVAGISGAVPSQQDSVCTDVPPPCFEVNCHAYINMSFGENCEILVMPEMLLKDPTLAAIAPEFYKVELFYGPGIPIPDNILRPEHAGYEITARITFLLEVCGGGTCEATIVLDEPRGCLITGTLDTAVYCIDPFLELDPMDPAYPKPELRSVCSDKVVKLEVAPDWIMVSEDDCGASDTSHVIIRQWYATTSDGETCSANDTIVVFRLPKLTDVSFLGSRVDTVHCSLTPVLKSGTNEVTYHAWKQPTGIHDYELPYAKLSAFVYDLPVSIVDKGYADAEECGRLDEYLSQVILIGANGSEVTIGDILSGDYFSAFWSGVSSQQSGYLLMHDIYPGAPGTEYYLFPQVGDELLSEDGSYVTVTADWFYNGHGQAPFWFSGGWPFVCGEGDCVSYCDGIPDVEEECLVHILVPRLTSEGMSEEDCDTLCLTEAVKCGLFIDREAAAETVGDCPSWTGGHFTVTQTCWGETESSCEGDSDLVTAWDEYDNDGNDTVDKQVFTLYQKTYHVDTIPPVFDFCYIGDAEAQVGIQDSIVRGLQPGEALAWERSHPTVYRTGAGDCSAEILVPDVRLIDNCSGIHQVKAMVGVPGGTRMVELELTDTEVRLTAGGDTCLVHTYSHTGNPIRVPFNGCDGDLIEVVYEAADGCWNQSEWKKYITIRDELVPVAIANRDINVTIDEGLSCVPADRYDEGSWDNCSIELLLARRSDWLGANIDICGNVETTPGSWPELLNLVGLNGDGTVTISKLQALLSGTETGDYYASQMAALHAGGSNDLKVLHGWIYDIAFFIAEHCSDGLQTYELKQVIDEIFVPGYGNELAVLGGGWIECVPFECGDACEVVPSELLVMDGCGNWNTAGTETHVEDHGRAREVRALKDLTISCEAYTQFYKEIAERAAGFNEGGGSLTDTTGAYAALDAAFGTYVLDQVDNQGRPVNVIGAALEYGYSNVTCGELSETVYDEKTDHDGNRYLEPRIEKTTYLDTSVYNGLNGLYAVNCSGTLSQDIWLDMDECGQGEIIRRFFISGGCGADAGKVTEVWQRIKIESACAMRESMFDLPVQLGSSVSPVCLPEGLSETYMPDTIGGLAVKASLEGKLCNDIAVGYEVTGRKVSGHEDLIQYDIVWSAVDWCCAKESPDRELKVRQKVMAVIDPDCNVDMNDGDAGDTEGSSLIRGVISTSAAAPVHDVEMRAVLGSGSPMTALTGSDGGYLFNVRSGSDVSLIPGKNTGFAYGVTTQDLIAMQRHILGKQPLEDRYAQVAADVNGNGSIEVFDMTELRKLILQPDRYQFANNTSWRFFDREKNREVYELRNITQDAEIDWVGVKIGDVNMSGEVLVSNRNLSGALHLNVADKQLKTGESYRMEVTSDNFADITGMQYTLHYLNSEVEIVSVEAGALSVTQSNYYRYAPGVVTWSWHESAGVHASAGEVLFTIVVEAKSGVRLRDVLSLSNRVTRTEAYDADDNLKDVQLRFDGREDGFALYQNTPNPYRGETTIGFNLPETSKATLTIYDVTGKLIKRIAGSYESGYHEVRLRSAELGVTGVLYYQLDTEKHTATKKMIVVE